MQQEGIGYVSKVLVRILGSLRGVGEKDAKVKQDVESSLREFVAMKVGDGDFRIGREDHNGLYVFTGRRYEYMSKEMFETALRKAFETLDVGVVYRMNSVRKMYDDVCTSIYVKDYVPSKEKVSFKNVILDLGSLETYSVSGDHATEIYLDFDYDPRAKCPLWNKFLHEVLPEQASIDVLQEFLGCVFIDRHKLNMEYCLFLYGTGANGKSVVSDVMGFILGDNMSRTSLSSLCSGFQTAYYLAEVDGKLLNYSSDENADTFSSGIFKKLVSGEPMTVRRPAEKPYTARNMPLLASNMNKIPPSTDATNGYYRRLLIIPFSRQFSEEEQDKELKYKLQSEVSGIFNWVMEGRRRIMDHKGLFTNSDEVNIAKLNARISGNSLLQYLSEMCWVCKQMCKDDEKVRLTTQELYDGYKKWCDDNGFHAKSAKTVKDEMVSEGFEFKKVRVDSAPSEGAKRGVVLWRHTDGDEELEEQLPF